MNLKQSATDPCIFYKQQGGKVVLILILYVDDALCAGERKEVEWAYKKIEDQDSEIREIKETPRNHV
jgi:hypothetical protein